MLEYCLEIKKNELVLTYFVFYYIFFLNFLHLFMLTINFTR